MSDSIVSSLNFATSQTYIYMGVPFIIGGVIGGLLNIIIFLSLQIYRQSSSAFYLTVVSIINIGQLLTGLLSYVLVNIVGIDWIESSVFLCKLRYTAFQACGIISPTCLCLVTIDQFLAISTRLRWQQWSNIKIAHRLSFASIIFWLLYGIPYLFYYNPTVSPITKITSCIITNAVYSKYNTTVHVPVFMFAFPFWITIIFGSLAYRNVRDLAHRTIPLVRRRHEIQLTVMVLVQIIFNAFATTPVFITRIVVSNVSFSNDPITAAQIRFAIALTTCIYYSYYAIPFYIYICVSERFRKQLRYVIIDMHLNRWRRIRRNDIVPQIQIISSNEIKDETAKNIELIQ
ncbi:unnamed protein product [Adineta steineri]|uniref:G-protein coupled receptors family 1 profile domain-containing protein n=2 Tax=Adineta steineri TaxID=433720 RepID=A0A814QD53_9BILA|nr:unnamed protein product [Adineta steineri]